MLEQNQFNGTWWMDTTLPSPTGCRCRSKPRPSSRSCWKWWSSAAWKGGPSQSLARESLNKVILNEFCKFTFGTSLALATQHHESETMISFTTTSIADLDTQNYMLYDQGWAFFIAIYCESNILHRLETSENIVIPKNITIFLRYLFMHSISQFWPFMDQSTTMH